MPNRPSLSAGFILGWPMFFAGLGTMGVAGADQVQSTLGGLPVVGTFFEEYKTVLNGVTGTKAGARGGIGVGGLAMTAIGGWGIGMLHY